MGIIFKRPFTRTSYRNILLQEFDVSLLALFNHKKTKSKLITIDCILKPKDDEEAWQCIALLHILTHKDSYRMIKKYCEKYKKQHIFNDPNKILMVQAIKYTEKYKLDLLAALLDDTFFDEVRGWYMEIASYKFEEQVKPEPIRHSKFIQFRYKPKEYIPLAELAAFSGAEYDKKRIIFQQAIDDIGGLYCGDVMFIENEKRKRLEARFQFKDKETKEVINFIPCYLEVEITLNDDKKDQLPFELNRIMISKEATIQSNVIYNVAISKGFKVTNIQGREYD